MNEIKVYVRYEKNINGVNEAKNETRISSHNGDIKSY